MLLLLLLLLSRTRRHVVDPAPRFVTTRYSDELRSSTPSVRRSPPIPVPATRNVVAHEICSRHCHGNDDTPRYHHEDEEEKEEEVVGEEEEQQQQQQQQ